ncbi:DUF4199 domain-containing protein [Flavilitoribacter nigricans]|uniref:DUF4199 domain-containing protein n=1 Tax=Flavilitoribacter nigricans (strain ATCC 23147 / DSM 23189 / NBRC 102662 / NCIMB 1420 / SS-2) TaxID=1122177 RepID=A0A2D0NFV0_FLAN2|nr:DUF4199 domain-containing protein [Flavilitoribacter nigricans]PHN07256.1 hypothetical protein CRP01_06400 [Flavilitoribacter nigricans DSM 23189 = NBRC 102662]
MKKLAFRFGLWMLAGFVAFFLLMHLFGLSNNYNLRVLNGVIHLGVIYFAIKAFRSKYPDTVSNYVSGTAMGMYVSVVGVLGFTIFMILFLSFNPGFLQELREAMPMGDYLTPITASLFILMEGIVISLIGSYILTRVIDMNLART